MREFNLLQMFGGTGRCKSFGDGADPWHAPRWSVKEAAEFVVSTNDHGGAAEAIRRFALGQDA